MDIRFIRCYMRYSSLRTLSEKVFSTKEAVSRFIEDGDSVVMGTALETAILFAVGHEIITTQEKERDI